jgi:hypothetical protein
MHTHELLIRTIRRDAEHAVALHRLARDAAHAGHRDRSGLWRRFVAWMPPPTSGGPAVPVIPYPRHEAG